MKETSYAVNQHMRLSWTERGPNALPIRRVKLRKRSMHVLMRGRAEATNCEGAKQTFTATCTNVCCADFATVNKSGWCAAL